jgi:hypothetical protein
MVVAQFNDPASQTFAKAGPPLSRAVAASAKARYLIGRIEISLVRSWNLLQCTEHALRLDCRGCDPAVQRRKNSAARQLASIYIRII